jgi:DNA-binding FadR family transcriptional regulator
MAAKIPLARVKRANVKEQIFAQLRDQIVAGAWPPGSKIPSQNELTRKLGVSRVSLREAVHMLASLGLLESRQGGGTFVKEYSGEILFSPLFPMIALDTTDLFNVLEYRRIVEKGTAALVAEKAGEKEIDDLEAAYREMLRLPPRLGPGDGKSHHHQGEQHHRKRPQRVHGQDRKLARGERRTHLSSADPQRHQSA